MLLRADAGMQHNYVTQYFYRVTKLIPKRTGSTRLSLIAALNGPRGSYLPCLAPFLSVRYFITLSGPKFDSEPCQELFLTQNSAKFPLSSCPLQQTDGKTCLKRKRLPFLPENLSRHLQHLLGNKNTKMPTAVKNTQLQNQRLFN